MTPDELTKFHKEETFRIDEMTIEQLLEELMKNTYRELIVRINLLNRRYSEHDERHNSRLY